MAVNPSRNRNEILNMIRSTGYEGDSYAAPTEYDPGQLTQQVPEGSAIATVGYAENNRYGVGSPSGYRKFNYTSESSKRTLPAKKGFKVKK